MLVRDLVSENKCNRIFHDQMSKAIIKINNIKVTKLVALLKAVLNEINELAEIYYQIKIYLWKTRDDSNRPEKKIKLNAWYDWLIREVPKAIKR